MSKRALREYLSLLPFIVAVSFLQGCTKTLVGFLGLALIIFLPAYLVVKLFGLFRSKPSAKSTATYNNDDGKNLIFQIQGAALNRSASLDNSSHVASGQFVLSDTPISFCGFKLPFPMFYVGSPARSEVPDPSLLDPKLPIAKKIPGSVHEMNYWPSYSNMDPSQRRVYLEWLSRGRESRSIGTGFVFVFFYGLERRAVLDQRDIKQVLSEVVRLRSIHSSNSFQGYSGRLIAFCSMMSLDKLQEHSLDDAFPPTNPNKQTYSEDALNAVLCWYLRHDVPLSWRWAMQVARNDPLSTNSVIVDRNQGEFEELFRRRYEEKYGLGIKLRSAKANRVVHYAPASSVLMRQAQSGSEHFSRFYLEMENPLKLTSQFKTIVDIWSSCIDDLRSFSRAKAKVVEEVLTSEAWEKLPEELRSLYTHPEQHQWEALIQKYVDDSKFAIIPVSEIAGIRSIAHQPRLTPTQSKKIAETGSLLGYAIEPDPRLTAGGLPWDSKLVVYHDEDPDEHLSSGSPFRPAAVMLHLALSIAAADGQIAKEELDVITSFLDEQFILSPSSKRRLEAMAQVMAQGEISLSGLGKRIQSMLDELQRSKVGRFLVAVAAVDGVFTSGEVKALKKAYRSLGLDPEQAVREIEQIVSISDTQLTELKTIRPAQQMQAGEALPMQPAVSDASAHTPVVRLDRAAINQILIETKEVASMLGSVLAAEDDEEDYEVFEPANRIKDEGDIPVGAVHDSLDARFSGLDLRFHAIANILLERETWQHSELKKLVDDYGLMLDGTIETINEWADDTLGDFLIEEGEPYTINRELMNQRG